MQWDGNELNNMSMLKESIDVYAIRIYVKYNIN